MYSQCEWSRAGDEATLLGMVVRIFQNCLATVTLPVGSEHSFVRAGRFSMDINALLHFPSSPQTVSESWPIDKKHWITCGSNRENPHIPQQVAGIGDARMMRGVWFLPWLFTSSRAKIDTSDSEADEDGENLSGFVGRFGLVLLFDCFRLLLYNPAFNFKISLTLN